MFASTFLSSLQFTRDRVRFYIFQFFSPLGQQENLLKWSGNTCIENILPAWKVFTFLFLRKKTRLWLYNALELQNMLVIFTILHRLLCHIWLILLAGIYGGISMGWNVKHPTKWVSYRLLYKTFWVPSLEAWLKWLHGFSIFFGSKVKVFAALLSGGSKMLFRGCVERVNIWEWGHGSGWESHPWGKSDQPLMNWTLVMAGSLGANWIATGRGRMKGERGTWVRT